MPATDPSLTHPARLSATLQLRDPSATERLGALLAKELRRDDTLLLRGNLGAGKSTLARKIIRSLQGPENAEHDIPSPSFTLVQTYETRLGPLWHVDLYRLNDPEEVWELGLDEALGHDLCLIEWPERLGPDVPDEALSLDLEHAPTDENARILHLAAQSARWLHVFGLLGVETV